MLEYREVLVDELEKVAVLYNELLYTIQKEGKDQYWDFDILSKEDTANSLKEFISDSERKIFIAKEDEEIVGFVTGEIINCHLPVSSTKKIGYISGAYVSPEYRGKGVMKKLDGTIIEYFRSCGLKYIELNFISNNIPAKKSWNSLGYRTFREQARKSI